MTLEWLINDTYQVTRGNSVLFQGTLYEAMAYMQEHA